MGEGITPFSGGRLCPAQGWASPHPCLCLSSWGTTRLPGRLQDPVSQNPYRGALAPICRPTPFVAFFSSFLTQFSLLFTKKP